jgi:hypothetical protein
MELIVSKSAPTIKTATILLVKIFRLEYGLMDKYFKVPDACSPAIVPAPKTTM